VKGPVLCVKGPHRSERTHEGERPTEVRDWHAEVKRNFVATPEWLFAFSKMCLSLH